MDKLEYVWYSKPLKAVKESICYHKVMLAAFIKDNREELLEDGIEIYPAEPEEALPPHVRTAWKRSRNEAKNAASLLYNQWVRLYLDDDYKWRMNPLKFADEHEDLAVPLLKAVLEENKQYLAERKKSKVKKPQKEELEINRVAVYKALCPGDPTDPDDEKEEIVVMSLPEKVDAYSRRIKKIKLKKGYKPLALPEDFYDFRKYHGYYEEVTQHFSVDADKNDPSPTPSAGGAEPEPPGNPVEGRAEPPGIHASIKESPSRDEQIQREFYEQMEKERKKPFRRWYMSKTGRMKAKEIWAWENPGRADYFNGLDSKGKKDELNPIYKAISQESKKQEGSQGKKSKKK